MEALIDCFLTDLSDRVFSSFAFEEVFFKHHLVFGLGPSSCV